MSNSKKYICSVCGYVYDQQKGLPEMNIPPTTKWKDVSDDFLCPLCKATKDAFEEEKQLQDKKTTASDANFANINQEKFCFGELSAICSNYAKGLEKQYLFEQAALFKELSDYFEQKAGSQKGNLKDLENLIKKDIDQGFAPANYQAKKDNDRGALRALVWCEKVTRMLNSFIKQAKKDKDFPKSNLYVCEICGFVYHGDTSPEICPVCKVPQQKIQKV